MSNMSQTVAKIGLFGVVGAAATVAAMMVVSRHPTTAYRPVATLESSRALQSGFGHLHLASAVSYANLTVYPVYAQSTVPARLTAPEFNTLAESMDKGTVQARESDCQCVPDAQPAGTFNSGANGVTVPGPEATNADQGENHRDANLLMVTNVSPKPTYVPDGQVIPGGGQDRGAAADTIIPARSAQVGVAAFCVEQNRSTGPSPDFQKNVAIAIPSVRYAMQVVGDQQPVWNAVAVATRHFGAKTPTGTYAALIPDRAAQMAVLPYTEALTVGVPAAAPGCVVGVVATMNGRIVCADLYRNPTLFNQMWPALLRSYALQAAMVRRTPRVSAPTLPLAAAGHWLACLDGAPGTPSRSARYTQVSRISNGSGAGTRTAASAIGCPQEMALLHEAFWTPAAALTN